MRKGEIRMAVITSDELTTAERKVIEERYAPYHRFEEFWDALASYECGRDCPNGWEENSVAGKAWDRGHEAGMRLHWERTHCPYARDDLDSRTQIATLKRLNAERKKKTDEAAAWARAFEPGQYPRLHLAGGQRAGRVGADRFRGRYVPHLVVDNNTK
jgi:hypothetical protein